MKVVVFLLQFCLHDLTCKKKRIMTKNDRTGPLKNIALAYNLIKKETLAQVFSCEFYEIFKIAFSHRNLWWLSLTNWNYNGVFKEIYLCEQEIYFIVFWETQMTAKFIFSTLI